MKYVCTFCDHEHNYERPDTMLKKYGTLFAVYTCPKCNRKIHRDPTEIEMTPDEMIADLAHRFGAEDDLVVKFAYFCEIHPDLNHLTYSALYASVILQNSAEFDRIEESEGE